MQNAIRISMYDHFFSNIEIRNYRGIKHLKIPSLKRINIIAGKNGVGKSSLLEAIFFIMNLKHQQNLPFVLKRSSEPMTIGSMDLLFNSKKEKIEFTAGSRIGKINCSLEFKNDHDISVNINKKSAQNIETTSIQNDSPILSIFSINGKRIFSYEYVQDGINTVKASSKDLDVSRVQLPIASYLRNLSEIQMASRAMVLSNIVMSEKLGELIESLNIIEPTIKDIRIIPDEFGQPNIFGYSDKWMPISSFGGGISTLFHIITYIIESSNGICSIEHFESEIYYDKLCDIWSLISKIAKSNNCQLFISTHSDENIKAAYKGIEKADMLSDLQFIRIHSKNGEHYIETYNNEELEKSFAFNIDIR
jgi:AAA15 family ATPase/GTPase